MRRTTSFKPGVVQNPGGRPRSTLGKTLAAYLRKKAPGLNITNEQAIAAKIMELARKGDREMINLVFDRMEGKPIQPISTSPDSGPFTVLSLVRETGT